MSTTVEASTRVRHSVQAEELVRTCLNVMRGIKTHDASTRKSLYRLANATDRAGRALWPSWDEE